jgi:N-acetylglucosamine kinase-like BadF-type ATPase
LPDPSIATVYLLGVDGGNTKTIALVARSDGAIVGAGRAGCSDVYGAASEEAALGEIGTAVDEALNEAGLAHGEIDVGGFNLAGADWPEDIDYLRDQLRERRIACRPIVVNDALGPLWANTRDAAGASIVCGTGLAVGARGRDGATWHASFWLESVGAGTLGSRALRAAVRAEMGIGPTTALSQRIPAAMGVRTVEEALHRATARVFGGYPRTRLAPVLLDTAEAGDTIAQEIVTDAGCAIGEFALVAARNAGLDGAWDLVMSGGVLRHRSPLLRTAIMETVWAAQPRVAYRQALFEPAVGAVIMAFDAAGIAVDDAVMERIMETCPPSSLFETLDSDAG